jgi:hypothetical protein
MNHRTIVLGGLLSVLVTASEAQEPDGRINLDVVSNSPMSTIVVAAVSFGEASSQCPEDRGTLRISRGTLAWIRSSARPRFKFISVPISSTIEEGSRATMRPTDDETLRYRIETSGCQIDIAVREQVHRDGSWVSLLVPKQERPSLPPEERRELQRQFIENLRTPKESTPSSRDWLDRWNALTEEMRAWSSPSLPNPTGTAYWPFSFEDKPQTCFEAVGDFHIERSGIRFAFLTPLPGDLNRFVIERTDLDANRRRLYFTRGDCRFELTLSQSVLRSGEWISVPLAPIPPSKG